ncbi:MAG: hypothetical protein AAF696_30185 [Bacteroidota bacterium]
MDAIPEPKEGSWQNWLNQLRNNSWNLELLVSGFSILLITQGQESLMETINYFDLNRYVSTWAELLYTINSIIYLILEIMLVSLVINVLLRGLWIGAVGLSSVKDKELNIYDKFAPRFQFLKYSINHWDDYIERLDKLCSAIFSFTFLSVFVFISFSLVTFLYVPLMDKLFFEYLSKAEGDWAENIGTGVKILFLLISFIYFIDFLSLGWIKRIKGFDKVYYPLYRFMGYITFAFLYRDLYYHLIIKKYTRRFGLLLFPFVFFSTYSINFYVEFLPYFPGVSTIYEPIDKERPALIPNNFYDDERDKEAYIYRASIPSKIIKDDYLPLFISYRTRFNADFTELCDSLAPARSEGLNNNTISIGFGEEAEPEVEEKYLECLEDYFQLSIDDSLEINSPFMFYVHPEKSEEGFLNVIDIKDLDRGRHFINIRRKRPSKEEAAHYASIYFWK